MSRGRHGARNVVVTVEDHGHHRSAGDGQAASVHAVSARPSTTGPDTTGPLPSPQVSRPAKSARHGLLDPDDAELIRERTTAFDVLYRSVRSSTEVDDDQQLWAQATAARAVVHGLATLWLTGNLPYPRDSTLVRDVFRELGPALIPVVHAGIEGR